MNPELSCEICGEKIHDKENMVQIEVGNKRKHHKSFWSRPAYAQLHVDCLSTEIQVEELEEGKMSKVARDIAFAASDKQITESDSQ